MEVSQKDDRHLGRTATTARLGLAAFVSALLILAPPRASAQCTNIAGSWNATETGTVTIALTASDGESDNETDPVSGSGIVAITQTGTCTFQYTPISTTGSSLVNSGLTPSQLASLVRTVTVSGNNVTETGVFAILNTAAAGLTISSITGNVETGTGQVNTGVNPHTMTLNETANLVVTGSASSNGQSATFTMTISSSTTATFMEESPIAITPPGQTGIASGLAYNGLFTATGGSGAGYTWCVQSGSNCVESGSPLPEGFILLSTGLLSSTGSPAATPGSYPLTVQVTDSAGNMQPQGFTLVIGCPMKVTWSVRDSTSMNTPVGVVPFGRMVAQATSTTGVTLSVAATECGFSMFDWVQTITQWPKPDGNPDDELFAEVAQPNPAAPTIPLSAPYSDPPLGGYTYQFPQNFPVGSEDYLHAESFLIFQPNVASAYPFYYSTLDIAAGCAFVASGTCSLLIMSDAYTLNFVDTPHSPLCSPPETCIAVQTQLVGICTATSSACGVSGGPSTPLYQWNWETDFNGSTGGIHAASADNIYPVDPGSGTGGITVMGINGVPTPTVTVAPLATDITTAQGLAVTVTVNGASSSPRPTGSVTLTGGTYTSAATVLSGGTTTISIPSGSLATGADTLTAVYTPDNASAATFSVSSGSAQVTVTVPLLTPTVTVTPSSTSILSAQQLPVTIAVSGGSGNPTPTGTLILSSGSYISAITSLSSGTVTITIPGNSLSAGSYTLTADYSPDTNSSSTYYSAFGTSSPVTVTQSPTTATPTFSPASGTYATAQMVTISDSTSGATIYYTINGTNPTTNSTVYGGPFSVSSTETLEAIAVATGDSPSAVASATYIITPAFTGPGIESVSAILPQQTQTITITGSGFGTQAAYSGNSNYINFVDNSGVTFSAGTGGDAIGLSISSWTNTQVVISGLTGAYGDFGWVLNSGDKVTISVSNPQTNAGPYTCTNIIVGAGPTSCGTVPEAATPTFNVPGGTYTSTQTVTISDATAGATIYYTTNGTTPTISSTKYTGAITVSSTETFEAIATASGYSTSVVGSASYTITGTVATTKPTVTVIPSLPNIPVGKAVTVTVEVRGSNGSATPTGLVTLTSGAYSSPDAALNSGIANITIPAGSLATGSNTLTGIYTPDSASASTYVGASGTSSVTIIAEANALNEWIWMGGTSSVNKAGVYGTLGIPAADNVPGGRYVASTWTDGSGNFWLFGGFGYDANGNLGDLNDLWEFNPSTNEWVWVGGSSSLPVTGKSDPGQRGVYGTFGIPAVGIIPGGRHDATSWTDKNGHLWLFGGEGYDGDTGYGYLNDLWEFNPSTNQWAWRGGSSSVGSSIGQTGVYGTLASPASGNAPGGRFSANSWTDGNGNLWLFGGYGVGSTSTAGQLNDLWEFNPTSNEWAWMGGSSAVGSSGGQPGVYGTLGAPAPGNVPGGREFASSWTDSSGHLWLFGGAGKDANDTEGNLNDLWEFNPTSNEWVWMSGSKTVGSSGGQPGVYGTLGTPAAGNTPGGRDDATSWTDGSGNLWLFGGYGAGFVDFNDLWEFNPSTQEWTWMAGSNTVNQAGVYGTLGISASANAPGGRSGASGWTDSSGRLWLFGGVGIGASGNSGDLNDLWMYQPAGATSPSFALSLSSSSLSVAQGSSTTDNITVTDANGFTGAVTLAATGLPSGVTATITQPGTGSSGSISLQAASNATLVSNQTITITASGSGVSSVTSTFSLTVSAVPTIAISSVSPGSITLTSGGSSQAVTVNLTDTNYTGSVTLSTSTLPTGVTATITQPGTGSSGSIALQAASNATLVTNQTITITASGSGVSSVTNSFTLTVAAGGPAVSLSPTGLTFQAQLVGTTSSSQSVTLTNTGNGTLTFTAIAVSGPYAIATSGTTCSTSSPVAAAGTCAVAVTFTPTAAGTASGSLSFSDNAPGSPQTITLSGTGQDFSFGPPSGSSTSVTITPGQPGTYTLSVGGEDGLSGTVSFTCAGAPSEATCTVSPNPLTLGSTATNVTVTVTTTAPSVGAPRSRPFPPAPPLSPGRWALWMLALIFAALAWAFRRLNQPGVRQWKSAIIPLAAGLLLTLALAGCGGGGSGGGTPPTSNPGTPAGTYTLTVTGTTGTLSHSFQLTLIVS